MQRALKPSIAFFEISKLRFFQTSQYLFGSITQLKKKSAIELILSKKLIFMFIFIQTNLFNFVFHIDRIVSVLSALVPGICYWRSF